MSLKLKSILFLNIEGHDVYGLGIMKLTRKGEIRMTVQPEKFYESCLTYNIIQYFDEVLEQKVYPFSISQLEEKSAGYDYGYEVSNKSFLFNISDL